MDYIALLAALLISLPLVTPSVDCRRVGGGEHQLRRAVELAARVNAVNDDDDGQNDRAVIDDEVINAQCLHVLPSYMTNVHNDLDRNVHTAIDPSQSADVQRRRFFRHRCNVIVHGSYMYTHYVITTKNA